MRTSYLIFEPTLTIIPWERPDMAFEVKVQLVFYFHTEPKPTP